MAEEKFELHSPLEPKAALDRVVQVLLSRPEFLVATKDGRIVVESRWRWRHPVIHGYRFLVDVAVTGSGTRMLVTVRPAYDLRLLGFGLILGVVVAVLVGDAEVVLAFAALLALALLIRVAATLLLLPGETAQLKALLAHASNSQFAESR
jgi:hypothetical protein